MGALEDPIDEMLAQAFATRRVVLLALAALDRDAAVDGFPSLIDMIREVWPILEAGAPVAAQENLMRLERVSEITSEALSELRDLQSRLRDHGRPPRTPA